MIEFLEALNSLPQNRSEELSLAEPDCSQFRRVEDESSQLGFHITKEFQSKTYLTFLDGENLSDCLMH